MSLQAPSFHAQVSALAPGHYDVRFHAASGDQSSCLATAMKIVTLIVGFLVACASFAVASPLIGAVVALAVGMGGLYMFGCLEDGDDGHSHFFGRVLPFFVPASGSHVPVNGGHTTVVIPPQTTNVGVGLGHAQQTRGTSVVVGGGHAQQTRGTSVVVGGGHFRR